VISRRKWLSGAAAAGATAALGCPGKTEPATPKPVPRAQRPPQPPQPPTPPEAAAPTPAGPHAVATYELSHDGALLWVFHERAKSARLELQGVGIAPKQQRVALPEAMGRTASHVVGSLAPANDYRYRWLFDDESASTWHSFRTLPSPSAPAPVHFVFGADIISMDKYRSNITERMLATGAQAFISLGDWPYCDLPRPAAETLAEYRQCHRKSRAIPQLQKLLERMPVYAIFDDHEIKNDWDRAFVQKNPARANAGIRAWDEFFPQRAKKRYRSWRWGALAEVFMLDLRSYRSPYKDPPSSKKSMLGIEQREWLLRGIDQSTAAFQIVCSSVPLDLGTTREHWSAYPTERDLLTRTLARKDKRCVVLTADQHWFAAHHYPNGIREYQVGPIMAFTREPGPRQPAVVARSAQPNFGEISITPGSQPKLVFICRDRYGRAIYAETLRA